MSFVGNITKGQYEAIQADYRVRQEAGEHELASNQLNTVVAKLATDVIAMSTVMPAVYAQLVGAPWADDQTSGRALDVAADAEQSLYDAISRLQAFCEYYQQETMRRTAPKAAAIMRGPVPAGELN